jgi:hypothetical protein
MKKKKWWSHWLKEGENFWYEESKMWIINKVKIRNNPKIWKNWLIYKKCKTFSLLSRKKEQERGN